jgi:FKBP-type peptidyl-prolyl cis-trans isomerase FklB
MNTAVFLITSDGKYVTEGFMRFWFLAVLGVFLVTGRIHADETAALKSQKEKMSYIMGLDIGKGLKTQGMSIDPDILARGIKDFLSGKSALTDQEIREAMTAVQQELASKEQATLDKNRKESAAFLTGNNAKEGVVALPSGLKYRVIKPGVGKRPKPTDTVTVNYRATLMESGREFYNSYLRERPETLTVKDVIPGLMEALSLMQEGAKWLVFIPPSLAYGEDGDGRLIGPNANLVFEIELISVSPQK